jgi:predicted PurR-regulated permease PerM
MPETPRNDVTRTTLAVLFIGILIATCLWILRPFISSLVWATMIVIATWPLMLTVQKRLWGKRALAVMVMSMVLLLVLIVPLSLAIGTIINKSDELVGWVQSLTSFTIMAPPDWIGRLPFVGAKITAQWLQLSSIGPEELSAKLLPYAQNSMGWFVAQAGSVGLMILHFLLTVILSAVLYATGESAAAGVRHFARRLAGQRGEGAAILASQAIRGVALGVVGTALIQAALGGISLVICGVPAAAVLTAIIFMFCVAQIGPVLVMGPAVAWLYWSGQSAWGTVLLVCTIIVGTVDNFIRPVLIKKGADLPLLLIFAGVIGGLIAFGIIGLFIGPVVLAVTYTLLESWITGGESGEGGESAAEPTSDSTP